MVQSPLPLERLEEEDLIDLNDALFPCGLMACDCAKGALTPEENGIFADSTTQRRLADGQPFNEGLRIVFPSRFL